MRTAGDAADGSVLLAAIVLLLASLTTVGIGPGAQGSSANGSTSTTGFHWEAPKNFTGPFAAKINITVQERGWCTKRTRAAGTFNATSPIAYWETDTSGDPKPGGSFAGHGHYGVQAHAGPADTRRFIGPEGRWDKVAGKTERLVNDGFTLNIGAWDLGLWNGTPLDRPLTVDVDCEVPINVTLEAGQHARSFTETSLEGGVGASVTYGPLPQRLARDDGFAMDFDASHVRFQALPVISDLDTSANMTLDHPNGTETWTWDHAGPISVGLDGGPGRYNLSLDWYSDDNRQHMLGAIFGLDPVDSLDDAV